MKLYILFGSQTGTAEELSHDLARECASRLIPVQVLSLDSCLSLLPSITLAIFIVSTTGQGDPPTNMKIFWRGILSKSLPSSFLSSLNFTVFGLGDSTYSSYNSVARKLWVRVKQLGGRPFHEKGLGDDIHDFGYEAEYHPWCEGLWKRLEIHYPLLSQIERNKGLLSPIYKVEDGVEEDPPRTKVKLIEKKIVSEKLGKCFQVKFSGLEFEVGDCLGVYPKNKKEVVEGLMERLGWRDRVICIKKNPESPYEFEFNYPSSVKLSELLKSHLDLHYPASRYFIKVLSYFAEGLHKEKLAEMCEKSLTGRNEYHRYIVKEYRNCFEVLYDFSSISTFPLEYFLESVRPARLRQFSIASEKEIKLLVSSVRFTTPLGRHIDGQCTDYLWNAKEGEDLDAVVLKGGLIEPSPDEKVIFIATGTGIAALWGILEKRIRTGCYKNLLFYGTRFRDGYCFKQEIEAFEAQCSKFLAFSQGGEKKHVQDLIKENWEVVNEFLLDNCRVLICGKAKVLAKSVKESFIECLSRGLDFESAQGIVKGLEQERKICVENW